MLDAIKPLVESGIINDETRDAITEAWESQISEAREEIRAEMREEFADRYQHDKATMVEAVEKMVTESLTTEINEFQEEKAKIAEERANAKIEMKESAKKFESFLTKMLAEEIKELRADRELQTEATAKMEQFIASQLTEEIAEFQKDKQDVVETKVRLVSEAKTKMAEIQSKFIERSARLVKESVANKLTAEMTQLKEDITAARENMFGRRLFEAFASEFATTHLNENKEISALQAMIAAKDAEIMEAKAEMEATAKLVESKEQEIQTIKESSERAEKLSALLKPLNKEKAGVMSELLESVQTAKLQSAFDKYLPAVLGESRSKKVEKTVLAESRTEVTGDKTAKASVEVEDDSNVIAIKRLAGLK
jgi:hypothetical protein